MNFEVGDLVCHSTLLSVEKYRLGIVVKISPMIGMIKVKWCDGHQSLHAETFLKRIA